MAKAFMRFDAPAFSAPPEEEALPTPPSDDDKHDIIILPKNAVKPEVAGQRHMVVQRFPIDRKNGTYDPPEDLKAQIPGGRKARALGAPGGGRTAPAGGALGGADPDQPYGPGLVLAPTRPEPASQNGTCIIINQEHLRIRNAWTAARLNSEPSFGTAEATATEGAAEVVEPDIYLQPIPPRDVDAGFEMLVASGRGEVYHVRDGHPPEPLKNLGTEGEIWYQLRNGFVVGSVFCRELGRVLPMVNVLSISREEGRTDV